MDIIIEIVAVEVVDKGKYKIAEVTHKCDGKTSTKKVMSFGAQSDSFRILSLDSIKKGDVFTVTIDKNADGFWDWIKVKPGELASTSAPSASNPANKAPRAGNYETPEERLARQVWIVRQSNLKTAVEYLNHNKKNYDVTELFGLASSFESFVFGKTGKLDPVQTIIDMADDVPAL